MGRNKKITTQELIKYAEEYLIENPGCKLTIPLLGNFIRSKTRHEDIHDYLIRRNHELRDYISKLNSSDRAAFHKTVVTFRALDIDQFIEHNRTKDKMRNALYQRDVYYMSVSTSAVAIIEDNKKLIEKNNRLQEYVDSLKAELCAKDKKVAKAITKEKDDTIKKLKKIIDDYVYPDVANMLLQKEGVLEIVNEISCLKDIENHLIHPETDITKFKYSSVSKLWDKFDE
jgi:hypothetical protein